MACSIGGGFGISGPGGGVGDPAGVIVSGTMLMPVVIFVPVPLSFPASTSAAVKMIILEPAFVPAQVVSGTVFVPALVFVAITMFGSIQPFLWVFERQTPAGSCGKLFSGWY